MSIIHQMAVATVEFVPVKIAAYEIKMEPIVLLQSIINAVAFLTTIKRLRRGRLQAKGPDPKRKLRIRFPSIIPPAIVTARESSS